MSQCLEGDKVQFSTIFDSKKKFQKNCSRFIVKWKNLSSVKRRKLNGCSLNSSKLS